MRAALILFTFMAMAAPVAADMTPAPPRSRMPPAPSAEQEYTRGLAATRAKEWSVAAAAFTKAVEMKPAYPEAWNGLGYALRNQGRYPESLKAYDEALRLWPDYPEARLKPLDATMARELAEAIAKGK
ncbi:MAG: tetratricopeptide repeat protein [Candidatus Rokuibacteriota bacterium]